MVRVSNLKSQVSSLTTHYSLFTTRNSLLATTFFLLLAACCLLPCSAQNNRLTNEKGDLLWQYNQNVAIDEENCNKIVVTFIFINGISQTAISLRQELFYSNIEWVNTSEIIVEKEEYVDFVTMNLAPNQSLVLKYVLKNKKTNPELLLEKSAVLIMNEDFEVRKEVIPEQSLRKK